MTSPKLYAKHIHKLDQKGRVFIPAKQRHLFGEGALLTVWEGPSILLVPVNLWDEWEEEYFSGFSVGNDEYQRLKRLLHGNMSHHELDKAGRIIVPGYLLDYARIKKDIYFVGHGRYYELWAPEIWEEKFSLDEVQKFFENLKISFGGPGKGTGS